MKIIFDHNDVYVKLHGKKPKFMFKRELGYPVRRRSKYSFIYKDTLYNLKHRNENEVYQ